MAARALHVPGKTQSIMASPACNNPLFLILSETSVACGGPPVLYLSQKRHDVPAESFCCPYRPPRRPSSRRTTGPRLNQPHAGCLSDSLLPQTFCIPFLKLKQFLLYFVNYLSLQFSLETLCAIFPPSIFAAQKFTNRTLPSLVIHDPFSCSTIDL